MSDAFTGEIRVFGFNFPPANWAACDGTILPISQNPNLFSILGATYGGDGKTTFALPDLRGRAVMGPVGGALNALQGTPTVTLTSAEMPMHTHTAYANNSRSTATTAAGHLAARFQVANNQSYIVNNPQPALTTLAPQAVGPTGGNLPHDNMQPYLVANYCICLSGVYPPRS
ncbi:phage tail protein [Ralstonia sp. 24A2]|uniref:phage tail protein n=1 Tax=Ralstonia sp. 24A2 TaxID=3447364 RepID=UPI003F69E64F